MSSSSRDGVGLTFRVQCEKSQKIMMRGVAGETRAEVFLAQLAQLTGVAEDQICLLRGFPPHRLHFTPLMTVAEMGLVHQDTLIVQPLSQPARLEEGSSTTFSTTSSTTSSTPAQQTSPGAESQEGSSGGAAGIILRKTVPSDNSCMFTSVQFVMSESVDGGRGGWSGSSQDLRALIAGAVKADLAKYTEAFLGRSNRDYCSWIQKRESWGGAIELAILSDFYATEISVMDTQHNRMNRFGEDKNYAERVFLIYDGIHYDPLYMESFDGRETRTRFSVDDTGVWEQVMELGREARASHQFTDLRNFTLQCSVCKAKFVGQEEAQAHAEQTGHTNFQETV